VKRKVLLAIITAAMVLGGCSNAQEKEKDVLVPVVQDIENDSEAADETVDGDDAGTDSDVSEDETATDSDATEDETAADSTMKDYTDQIASEIEALSSDSLSDELVKVNELYNKYDEIRMNAPDQASINILSQWGTLVWKDETLSLLNRIKEQDSANYNDILAEYENWEKYVPTMAEKMSYLYEDGSIYPTIRSYNEAMRYKQEAYTLASTLADITKDVTFSFPDSTPCGYYGDYAGDSYLIITEGMESDSFNIVVHIDDTKELRGWGSIADQPGDEYILFTSDDGTVSGTISYFALDATFYVSETDGSVVGPEEAYSFTFKY
jgi:hypothetical protein